MTNEELKASVEDTILKLLAYCRKENWAGYDPFDGLNSKIFAASPFSRYKYTRLAFIQFMKRFPINLRQMLMVPKPKGAQPLLIDKKMRSVHAGNLRNPAGLNTGHRCQEIADNHPCIHFFREF